MWIITDYGVTPVIVGDFVHNTETLMPRRYVTIHSDNWDVMNNIKILFANTLCYETKEDAIESEEYKKRHK